MSPKRLTPLHYVASLFAVASLVYYISNKGYLNINKKYTELDFWLYISNIVIFFIAYSYSIFPYYGMNARGDLYILVLFLYILYISFKDKEK